MPRFYPITRTVTVETPGTGGDPTGAWAEDASVGDAPVVGVAIPDEAAVDDALASVLVKTPEDVTVDDSVSMLLAPRTAEDATVDDAIARLHWITPEDALVDDALGPLFWRTPEDVSVDDALGPLFWRTPEDVSVDDLAKTTILVTNTGRSGSPASDLLQETYVDQQLPTINYGATAPILCQAPTALNASQKNAIFEIDLTKFSGMVAQAVATPFTLAVKMTSDGLASSMNYSLRRHTSKPFVEDTVNWNTPWPGRTLGTEISAGATAAIGATLTTVTFTMTEAQLNNALTDGWVYLVFWSGSTVLRQTFSLPSREDATAADRPTLDLLLQRGT